MTVKGSVKCNAKILVCANMGWYVCERHFVTKIHVPEVL